MSAGLSQVFWVELLEDGKLSWFDAANKRKADFRCEPDIGAKKGSSACEAHRCSTASQQCA